MRHRILRYRFQLPTQWLNTARYYDPGANRLYMALRVTLSILLTALTIHFTGLIIPALADVHSRFILLGSIAAFEFLLMSKGENISRQKKGMVLNAFFASIFITLTGWCHGTPLVLSICQIIVAFGAMFIQKYGLMWAGIGTMQLFYFISLPLTIQSPAMILPAISTLLPALGYAYFFNFKAFPGNRLHTFRDVRRAYLSDSADALLATAAILQETKQQVCLDPLNAQLKKMDTRLDVLNIQLAALASRNIQQYNQARKQSLPLVRMYGTVTLVKSTLVELQLKNKPVFTHVLSNDIQRMFIQMALLIRGMCGDTPMSKEDFKRHAGHYIHQLNRLQQRLIDSSPIDERYGFYSRLLLALENLGHQLTQSFIKEKRHEV